MTRFLAAAVLFSLWTAGPVLAQSYTVSPPAFATLEGDWSTITFGVFADGRYMVCDGDLARRAVALKGIEHRADHRRHVADESMGRSWRGVTVSMSECDMTKLSQTYSLNSITTPSRVFSASVSWPTISGFPTSNPAPWGGVGRSLVFPFSKSWIYGGKNGVVTDYRFTGGAMANNAAWPAQLPQRYSYFVDSYDNNQVHWGKTATYGTRGKGGCEGAIAYAYVLSHGPGIVGPLRNTQLFRLQSRTALGRPVVHAFGPHGLPSGVPVPGTTCNRLYVDLAKPTLYVTWPSDGPLGTRTEFAIPANPALVGAMLWFQAAWNSGYTGGFMLTNACTSDVPSTPDYSNRKMMRGIENYPVAMFSYPTETGVPITRYVH